MCHTCFNIAYVYVKYQKQHARIETVTCAIFLMSVSICHYYQRALARANLKNVIKYYKVTRRASVFIAIVILCSILIYSYIQNINLLFNSSIIK